MMSTVLAIFLALIGLTAAEIIPFTTCVDRDDPNPVINCTVHEVRVTPCKDWEKPTSAGAAKQCELVRGIPASIAFDYTAEFAGDTLESRAYWVNAMMDMPLIHMDGNACPYTTCPAQPGQKQTYSTTIPLSDKFPVRSYNLKWRLWNKQGQECCFKFPIKLLKQN